MAPLLRDKTGTVFASACCVTALLNTVGNRTLGQEVIPLQPNPPPSEDNILRYGDVDVRPHFKAGVMYDDNVFIRHTDKDDDFLWIFTPGVLVGTGDYRLRQENFVSLNYEPDFIIFSENDEQNTIDHDLKFRLRYQPGPWTLGLEQDFATYSGANVDIGNRVDETLIRTRLGAKYEISPKTSTEINGQQLIDDYDGPGIKGFNEWIVDGWFDYLLTPKVKVGAGVTVGFVDVRGSANQQYQQPLLRVTYELTSKVDLRAAAGVEFRQFDGPEDNRTDGVFALGASYQPLENTRLSLDGYYRNQNSVRLVDQNYRIAGLSLSVRQTVFTKYHLLLGGGYENLDYYGTRPDVPASREDDFLFLRLGASWDVLERVNLGVFYQYRDNQSNNSGFEFDNHQAGVTVAYRF